MVSERCESQEKKIPTFSITVERSTELRNIVQPLGCINVVRMAVARYKSEITNISVIAMYSSARRISSIRNCHAEGGVLLVVCDCNARARPAYEWMCNIWANITSINNAKISEHR